MADWEFWSWTEGVSTSVAYASALGLSSASCLAFGGGSRSDFQSNISLNNWNSSMHYADDTAEGAIDLCSNSHLWPLTPPTSQGSFFPGSATTTSTGCALAGTYINMTADSPHPAHGIGLKFTHGTDVRCNPVQIWVGAGLDATGGPDKAYYALCDLTSAGPTWSTVNPSSKLSLRSHVDTAAQAHRWSFGIGVYPLAVGHTGTNRIKVEATYY